MKCIATLSTLSAGCHMRGSLCTGVAPESSHRRGAGGPVAAVERGERQQQSKNHHCAKHSKPEPRCQQQTHPPQPTGTLTHPGLLLPAFDTSTPPPRSPGGGPGCGSGSRPRCSARPRPGSCSRPMAEGRQLNASKPRSRLLGCRPWAESPDSFLTPLRTLALWCGIWTSADLRNK